MERKPFDKSELTCSGIYPQWANPMNPQGAADPKRNLPVTPKENFRLALTGQTPWWMPYPGWSNCDVLVFRPRMHPDNVVTHLVFDGESLYPYQDNSMRSSWYDLVWDYVPEVGGATVHPGNPKIPDISEWEKYVALPDLDDLDWEGCAAANREFCDSDKMVQLGILSGFWERLMSLMDVENAAVALIDEEQQPGVHRFLDRHTDLLIRYVDRMTQILPIDNVLVHDDWGSQKSGLFSLEVCREMIVPYLKRLTDFCHGKGLTFELHSCGKNETLVPCMIEAGVDLWAGQTAINDMERLAEQYKDQPILFELSAPAVPEGAEEQEIREIARAFVLRHKNHRVGLLKRGASQAFLDAIYEYSRRLYSGEIL